MFPNQCLFIYYYKKRIFLLQFKRQIQITLKLSVSQKDNYICLVIHYLHLQNLNAEVYTYLKLIMYILLINNKPIQTKRWGKINVSPTLLHHKYFKTLTYKSSTPTCISFGIPQ